MLNRIVLLLGASGSLGLTLYAGRHNSSPILPTMFAFWVLSPYAALFSANSISKRWSPRAQSTLGILTLLITAASLSIYGTIALGPPRPKIASFFLIVPSSSLILTAVAVLLMARQKPGDKYFKPKEPIT